MYDSAWSRVGTIWKPKFGKPLLALHFRSFARKVVPVLVKEGIGVLGMKSLGSGIILKSGAANVPKILEAVQDLLKLYEIAAPLL